MNDSDILRIASDLDCDPEFEGDAWTLEFAKRLRAAWLAENEPVAWPESMDKDDCAAWLKDRSQAFDPYIQGPLMRKLACFIEDTSLYALPPSNPAMASIELRAAMIRTRNALDTAYPREEIDIDDVRVLLAAAQRKT